MLTAAPAIDFHEFHHFAKPLVEQDGFQLEERNHPDFGKWFQKSIDLGHVKIVEHRACLHRDVNVRFDDGSLGQHVHHCISVDGSMGAHFENHNLTAVLSSQSYHQVFVPEEEYLLGMGNRFINVHVEVERDYYVSLLPESEKWSAELRRKLVEQELYYPGEFRLSHQMLQVIYQIFNSSLTGCMKRLLIEAKIHELIALQLNGLESQVTTERKSKDRFVAVRDYLDQTFLQEHSLKSIAREFALNECTLKKGFKSNFNTTVFDYLLSKRLEYARDLVQQTTHTVQEIGSLTGYKYPNHFSAAFKKKFGVSPASLRG